MAEFVTIAENIGKADVLVVPMIGNNAAFFKRIASMCGEKCENIIKRAIEKRAFSGKSGSFLVLDDGVEKTVLAGIGKNCMQTDAMTFGAEIYRRIKDSETAEIWVPAELTDKAPEVFLGMALEEYRFDKYKTRQKAEELPKLEQVYFHFEKGGFNDKKLEEAKALANGVRYARDLGNEPPNALTPEIFAEDIKRLEYLGLDVDVIGADDLKANGFNLLYEVGKASANAPRAVVVKWLGNPQRREFDAVLVGKGITFDTGGINLKSSQGLKDMKVDMGGAAAVVSALKVQALLKSKLNVAAVVGLAENGIGGKAYLPEDILTSASGQTVEIVNTDAEGRLALADCLWYACTKLKASLIVDLATLTGATANVLKGYYAVLFCRDEALSEALLTAGKKCGEKLWPLPFDKEFDKMVDSKIADVRQLGQGMFGGTLAACFLQHFVKEKVKWAHLDIAGCETADKAKLLMPSGATGFGVRLLTEYLKGIKAK